jgi:hypothetical protein
MEVGKQYEIILNNKNQIEIRRDEINKYYTSLFAALISFISCIDKITDTSDSASRGYNINYILILLAFLGIILSISWRLALGRMYHYIKGTEVFLAQMEKDLGMGFIKHMSRYLANTHAPEQVTKQEMLVPNTFIVVFIIIFTYSVMWCFFK